MQHLNQVSGATFNVGGGRANSLSLAELTTLCQPENRSNDVRWYISDAHKVIDTCDWRPKRDTNQMAEDVYRWLHDDESHLAPLFLSPQPGVTTK